MNEKEKAKELVDRFKEFADYSITATQEIDEQELLDNAKKCALICVDEIIKSHESYKPTMYNMSDVSHKLDYLIEVKNEIQKL